MAPGNVGLGLREQSKFRKEGKEPRLRERERERARRGWREGGRHHSNRNF